MTRHPPAAPPEPQSYMGAGSIRLLKRDISRGELSIGKEEACGDQADI